MTTQDTRHDELLPDYPQDRAARYRAAGLWGDLTLAEELHAIALEYPDRPAVISEEGRLSFAELDERTDRIAYGLGLLGLEPGERVVFQVNNRLPSVLAWYAVLKAGLVPVATLAAHRLHEIGDISARTQAAAHLVEAGNPGFDLVAFAREHAEGSSVRQVLVIGGGFEELGEGIDLGVARRQVEQIQAGLDPDGLAVFQLSGGTTGVPKLIPRRHAEYWYNAQAYARTLGWGPESRVAHLIPIIHNAGIVCGLHAPHSVGAALILGTPNAPASFPLLKREGTTDVLIGHGHFQPFMESGLEALKGSLQRVVLSGTKIPEWMFTRIQECGVWSGQLFGMAEGFFALTALDAPASARLRAVGTPMSALDEYRILEPDSLQPVPEGMIGELVCRGPYTLPGYYAAPEHNARAFTPDGFYRTGDLASAENIEGVEYLRIEGRIKDVINRGGEKVNAEEVELLLMRHPGVTRVALVAMPDARLGEKACAFLVAAGEPLSLEEVREHLAGLGVAKFKWPERLEWVEQLPQSNVGKIDKKLLRAWASAF